MVGREIKSDYEDRGQATANVVLIPQHHHRLCATPLIVHILILQRELCQYRRGQLLLRLSLLSLSVLSVLIRNIEFDSQKRCLVSLSVR